MESMLSNTPMDTMRELMKQNVSTWESMLGASAAATAKKKSD
jgi:hypothetical protein